VTRLGRWEWAFAAEAVARGDVLLLLDDESAMAYSDDRYVDLEGDPPQDGLLPCLTDDAFAVHRAAVEHDLEPGHAPRG
jgi:hypothetical protein